MQARTPWTDPLTIKEKIIVRWSLKKYDMRRFFEDGLWLRIAHHLPHRLVLWCYIVVSSNAWVATNKHPEDINYKVGYEAWEARRKVH